MDLDRLPLSRPAQFVAVDSQTGTVAVAVDHNCLVFVPTTKEPNNHNHERFNDTPRRLSQQSAPITAMAFGSHVLATVSAQCVLLYRVAELPMDNVVPRALGLNDVSHVSGAAWNAEGNVLALGVTRVPTDATTTSESYDVLILALDTGTPIAILNGHAQPVLHLVWGAQGTILTADAHEFRCWDLASRMLLFESGIVVAKASITCLAVDAAQASFVMGDSTGTLRRYDLTQPGCRLVQTIDVVAAMAQARDTAPPPPEASLVIGRRKPNPPPNLGAAAAEPMAVIQCPILYVRWEASGGVLVGTSTGVLRMRKIDWQLELVFPFADGEALSPFPASMTSRALVGTQISAQVVLTERYCVAVPTFDPCVVVGNVTDRVTTTHDGAVCIKQTKTLPASHWLAKTLPDAAGADRNKKRKKKKGPGKSLVFHNRIKSSGYGQSTQPRRQMFKPQRATVVAAAARHTKTTKKKKKGTLTASSLPVVGRDAGLLDVYLSSESLSRGDSLHGGPIVRVVHSPGGSRLLTCSVDGSARITKLPISRHGGAGLQLLGHDGPVRGGAWSSDGTLALTWSDDRSVRVWRVQETEPAMVIDRVRRSPPAGGSLRQRHARAEALRRASPAKESSAASKNPCFTSAISHASIFRKDTFVAVSSDATIHLYRYDISADTSDGDVSRLRSTTRYRRMGMHRNEKGGGFTTFACANAYLSTILVTADSSKCVTVVDVAAANDMRVVRQLEGAHSRAIHTVVLDERGGVPEMVLTAGLDGCIKLWDLRAAHACVQRFSGHVNRAQPIGVAFSACGTYVAAGSEDRTGYLFDIRSGTGTYVSKLVGHRDVVSDVSFCRRRPVLATASFDGTVRFWAHDAL